MMVDVRKKRENRRERRHIVHPRLCQLRVMGGCVKWEKKCLNFDGIHVHADKLMPENSKQFCQTSELNNQILIIPKQQECFSWCFYLGLIFFSAFSLPVFSNENNINIMIIKIRVVTFICFFFFACPKKHLWFNLY